MILGTLAYNFICVTEKNIITVAVERPYSQDHKPLSRTSLVARMDTLVMGN